MVQLPDAYWYPGKSMVCYPDLQPLYSGSDLGQTTVGLVKYHLDMSDEELACDGFERAPGRNPPIKQTNFTLPLEEEKPYWPFVYTEYLPPRHKYQPNWYEKIWGEYGVAA